MDLNKFTKYVTQWRTPLSPMFNYRYVVIGLDNNFGNKYYKAVFCENLMDVRTVEYGMYTQGIRYISYYKIADLDRFPRNTRGLSVVGLPFRSYLMENWNNKKSANTQAHAHIKNVMSKLGKA